MKKSYNLPPPPVTNVGWFNPETREFKIYCGGLWQNINTDSIDIIYVGENDDANTLSEKYKRIVQYYNNQKRFVIIHNGGNNMNYTALNYGVSSDGYVKYKIITSAGIELGFLLNSKGVLQQKKWW